MSTTGKLRLSALRTLVLRVCLLFILATGPYVPASLAAIETAKATATDGAATDEFGLAKPNALGACCGLPEESPGLFCSTVDELTCRNHKYCQNNHNIPCTHNADCGVGSLCLEGVFLGNKLIGPVGDCQGGPNVCNLGACCIGPGNCQDSSGAGFSPAACEALGGMYIGGFRCNESPCPVCPIDTPDTCQSDDYATRFWSSDRLMGIRRADDFQPTSNVINRICWAPCYLGFRETGFFECWDPVWRPPNSFFLKIYEDDGTGKPGALIPGIPGTGLPLIVDAGISPDEVSPFPRCVLRTAPVNPPGGLALVANDCYWLEITGLGELQQGGTCVVHWLGTRDGNNYSMRDTNGVYEASDAQAMDLSFCVSSGLSASTSPPNSQDGGCGFLPAACCRRTGAASTCSDGGTHLDCWGTNAAPIQGVPFPFLTCAEIGGNAGCPFPENDDCANAEMPAACMNQVPNPNLGVCTVSAGPPNIQEVCDMTLGTAPRRDCVNASAVCMPPPVGSDLYRCQFPTDNRLATTDGPGQAQDDCDAGEFQSDIWYQYVAPCDGYMTIDSCGALNTYDSMLMIFGSNSAGPNVCPTCPITDISQARACGDDNCGTSGGGSSIRIDVFENNCYLIRYGGWSQLNSTSDAAENLSGLDIGVVCDPPTSTAVAVTRCSGNGDLCGTVGAPACPGGETCDIQASQENGDGCAKNRYISFQPNNPGNPNIAYRVQKDAVAADAGVCSGSGYPTACTGAPGQGTCAAGQTCIATYPVPPGSPAGSCYLQAPVDVTGASPAFWPLPVLVSTCGPNPVVRDWTEDVIHVGDCEAIPGVSYTIFTNFDIDPGPGITFWEITPGLTISTAAAPTRNGKKWGDVAGPFEGQFWPCPDGFANVNDLLCLLKYIEATPTRAHANRVNIADSSAGSGCVPPQVNVGDVQSMVFAIATKSYGPPDFPLRPIDPALCPPCP